MSNFLKFKDRHNWLDVRIDEVIKSYHFPADIINNDICVDVGGNVGAFSVVNHNRFKRIIAIEPSMYSYTEYLNNMVRLGLKNVEVHRYAVSDVTGKILHLKPFIHGNESGNASTTSDVGRWDESQYEEVSSISLEDIYVKFNIKKINYLKVDCECGEYDFLMNKDLSNIDFLSIEIHHQLGNRALELYEYIKKYFNAVKIDGNAINIHMMGTFKNKLL